MSPKSDAASGVARAARVARALSSPSPWARAACTLRGLHAERLVYAPRDWGCEARATTAASRAPGARDQGLWLTSCAPDLCAASAGLKRPRRQSRRQSGRGVTTLPQPHHRCRAS
eukprot:2352706-Prymnesium_polylepis.1